MKNLYDTAALELFNSKIRLKWGRLTDVHIKLINGSFDLLSFKIQQLYNYSKELADRECDKIRMAMICLGPQASSKGDYTTYYY